MPTFDVIDRMPLRRFVAPAWYASIATGTPDILVLRRPCDVGAEGPDMVLTNFFVAFAETAAERRFLEDALDRPAPRRNGQLMMDESVAGVNLLCSKLPTLGHDSFLHYPPPCACWPHLTVGMSASSGTHPRLPRGRYLATAHPTLEDAELRMRFVTATFDLVGISATEAGAADTGG